MTVHVYLKIRNHRKQVVTFASTQLARCIKGSVKVSLVIFVKVSIYVFIIYASNQTISDASFDYDRAQWQGL